MNLTEFIYQFIYTLFVSSSHVNQSLQWMLESPKLNKLAKILIERTLPCLCLMKQNLKIVHKEEEGDQWRKKYNNNPQDL